MVWGAMSSQAMTELHIVPQNSTVSAQYYVDNILQDCLLPALNRTRNTGGIFKRKLVQNMSEAIFQQDGAPSHTALLTQNWPKNNIQHFWAKEEWPPNSPDLNPIENLWSIVQQALDKMTPATNRMDLIQKVKKAWSQISPDVLPRLVMGMPERVSQCIKLKGGHIDK